jgi:cytochrome o ubiquinol oxidase subunit 2
MKKPKLPRWTRSLPLSTLMLLGGCNMTVLDPKGLIGVENKSLILTATWLMLLIVVPVIILTLFFAWKYRASNTSARYEPDWSHSTAIEVVIWLIPCVIIVILGYITWKSTHDLDPYKPIESNVKPITIEVVSLNWKWLFIYPEQKIATVNEIALPLNTPVQFKITSDSIMNSFFIPQLGSMVYAMAGMQTQLHLIANHAGVYDGVSSNYSGGGFSDMKFKAKAMSNVEFDEWVKQARGSSRDLTLANYENLAKPSEKEPVAFFANVDPQLYHGILHKYMDGAGGAIAGKGTSFGAVCTSVNTVGDGKVSMAAPAAPAQGSNS